MGTGTVHWVSSRHVLLENGVAPRESASMKVRRRPVLEDLVPIEVAQPASSGSPRRWRVPWVEPIGVGVVREVVPERKRSTVEAAFLDRERDRDLVRKVIVQDGRQPGNDRPWSPPISHAGHAAIP